MSKIDQFIRSKRFFFLAAFFIGATLDVLIFHTNSDFSLFGMLFIWIIVLRTFQFKSDTTFKLSLGLLTILFIFFVFARNNLITERIAVWLYFVLVVGIIQQCFELNVSKKDS